MIGEAALGGATPRAATVASAPERLGLRDVFSMLALVATFVAVVGLFAISPIALEARGIDYIDADGGFLSKFHPSTSIAATAFLLRCLAARRPVHLAWRLTTDDAGVLLMLTGTIVAAFFAAAVDKTPVTPLVDTFILPGLVFVLLRDLDRRAADLLAALVALVLVANAGIAIIEYWRGWHLIQAPVPPGVTNDPTKANEVFSWKADMASDWRAQALLGHPLVNGLVVGSFMICLAAPGSAWIPLVLRLPLLGLQGFAMLCFGARTALVLSIALAAWLLVIQVAAAIERGVRFTSRQVAPLRARRRDRNRHRPSAELQRLPRQDDRAIQQRCRQRLDPRDDVLAAWSDLNPRTSSCDRTRTSWPRFSASTDSSSASRAVGSAWC